MCAPRIDVLQFPTGSRCVKAVFRALWRLARARAARLGVGDS